MPQELAQAKIDEANFKKSLDYGIDKLGFGMFESTFSFCENLLNLLIGLSPLLWDTATYYATSYGLVNKDSSLVYTEIIQSAPFLGVVQIINEVIYVWLSLYSTFVIEEKHGFNETTLSTFFMDKLKSLVLSRIIGILVLSVMIYIVVTMGPYFYVYLWLFMFTFSLFFMTIWPERVAPLRNKYTPIEGGPVYDAIKKLADSVELPLTELFVVDGSQRSAYSNAYFYV